MNMQIHQRHYGAMGQVYNGGMMGMMGMNMMQGIQNHRLNFSGTPQSLIAQIEALTEAQLATVTDANLVVEGRQIKPINNCCIICTVIWGGIIIVPLFYMCCDWWRKAANPAYDMPIQSYQVLRKLFKSPNCANITLRVMDNALNAQKTHLLYTMLADSRLRGFTFDNKASPNNFAADEYDSFERNMKPIKKLSVISDIRWYTTVVL